MVVWWHVRWVHVHAVDLAILTPASELGESDVPLKSQFIRIGLKLDSKIRCWQAIKSE